MQNVSAYFCPECASPSLSFSELVGGDASCRVCNWKGLRTDLLEKPFQQDVGNPEQLVASFERDLRVHLAKDIGIALAKLLDRWGFLYGDADNQKVLLGRYLRRMARATVLAILEERALIEKESGR